MRSLFVLAAVLVVSSPVRGQSPSELVHWDSVGPDGQLVGGSFALAQPSASTSTLRPAVATTVHGGANANRVDFVFVGDGYTAPELADYATQVDALVAEFFALEPFRTYASYFSVHRIDVVSNESGIDGDPPGTQKDTAMDMAFLGTNYLWVDVPKALGYANNAPDVDLVATVANSGGYGGLAFRYNNLFTVTAFNESSGQILIHESGHALGNLFDEYFFRTSGAYNGPEPRDRNASVHDSEAMARRGLKWAPWLGHYDPDFDGLVGAYEGCRYRFGIYRPSDNSLMRSLDRPFNLPSVEGLLIEIYKIVEPIDDASDTAVVYTEDDDLFVVPLEPKGRPLAVQWFLDGQPIPGATGATLDLAQLGLPPGLFEVSVTVTDETAWVRNEFARTNHMRQALTYSVLAN